MSEMRTGVALVVSVMLAATALVGCGKAYLDKKELEIGSFPACLEGKWGFMNRAGVFNIKPQFDDAWFFSEGLACVKVGEKYGYVDKTGKFAVKPQLTIVEPDSEVRTVVKLARVDGSGKFIWNPRWDIAEVDSTIVRVGNRYGHLNGGGEFIWDPQLDSACSHSRELALVKILDLYGWVDTTGKFTRNVMYDWPTGFSEGYAQVNVAGKLGYIDKTGRLVDKPRFGEPSPEGQDKKYACSMRFCAVVPQGMSLSQAWNGAGTSLNYESLGYDREGYDFTQPFGARAKMRYDISDFRAFTVIVLGQLPHDDIIIRAFRVTESGAKETAFVAPRIISEERPFTVGSIAWREVRTESDLSAFTVRVLNPHDDFALPTILPGQYHLFLVKDGRELSASDLTIRRAANLPALPLSRPWKD
jgi:hypothetical protein